MSTILGGISLISLGIVVYLSYRKDGAVPNGYGVTALFAAIFSITGLILGVVTVREKEYYRLFPWLGVILNLVVLGGISLILYLGAYFV